MTRAIAYGKEYFAVLLLGREDLDDFIPRDSEIEFSDDEVEQIADAMQDGLMGAFWDSLEAAVHDAIATKKLEEEND